MASSRRQTERTRCRKPFGCGIALDPDLFKGKSAEKIAEEILAKFGSFKGIANQPLDKFLKIKGIGDVKIIRIAAAFEIARRCVNTVLDDLKKDSELRKEVFGE